MVGDHTILHLEKVTEGSQDVVGMWYDSRLKYLQRCHTYKLIALHP